MRVSLPLASNSRLAAGMVAVVLEIWPLTAMKVAPPGSVTGYKAAARKLPLLATGIAVPAKAGPALENAATPVIRSLRGVFAGAPVWIGNSW